MTQTATVSINGRDVLVEWSPAAAKALAARNTPLIVELELYFSCLVKKFVHFHDDAPGRSTVAVGSKLRLYFRPVTSTACHMEQAEALGRQPEVELDTDAVRKMAPKKVSIDHVKGAWRGSYSL
ncbi:hypothetical protein [Rhodoferax sp. BAB1]|jgi:hypothetical protein|uniref:hypothetical protein n=1 Tax=Rhodoferax sp. BAB1 TaxID=2741720 RepID=UPI0015770984|nr:hypothetical protein [Rhodoferax sp. BAB1]QKO22520.1 hypothetical protein HTY51_11785 [Rhodoferax sp. BAB1]